MKVSVVCIADRPFRLPLLVWSLIAQTYTDWELIVLDQSHDDRGVDCMIPIVPSSDDVFKIRVVKCERYGDWGQAAKEAAAKDMADGELLMFPNDDAYYTPTALSDLVDVINQGADLALCGWLYDQMGYVAMPPSTMVGHVDVGGFMVRRDLFLKVGWPDKSQTGDAKLIAALIRAGGRVGATPRVLYVKN